MHPLHVRVHGSFVEDTVTRVAYLWNTYLGGYDVNVRAASVAEMVDAIENQLEHLGGSPKLAKQRPVMVDAIDFAGHGYPGGWNIGLDVSDLEQPRGSPENTRWSRLAELKSYWSPDNEGLTLRMCETSQGERGQRFLAELAKTIGAKVRGWTGCYEFRPTGYEITATPQGEVARTGNTGRHWQLLNYHQAKPWPRRILTAPVEGLEWLGRMADLW